MEAAVVILFIAAIIGLIFGGIALNQNISEEYDYNIFSVANIFMACAALVILLIAVYIYNESGTMTANIVVLAVIAAFIYIALFIIDLQKTTPIFAVLSIIYQTLISSVIVFVIIIAILYFFARNSKKE